MTQIKLRLIVKSLIKERGSLRSVARKATTNIVFGIFMAQLLKNCKNTGGRPLFCSCTKCKYIKLLFFHTSFHVLLLSHFPLHLQMRDRSYPNPFSKGMYSIHLLLDRFIWFVLCSEQKSNQS